MQVNNVAFDGAGGKVNRYQSQSATITRTNNFHTARAIIPATTLKYESEISTYVVKSGDTLGAIASRLGMNWQTLYEDNKELIGSNPNVIYPGQELIIRTQTPAGTSTPTVTPAPAPEPVIQQTVVQTYQATTAPAPQPVAQTTPSSGDVKVIPASVPQNGLVKNHEPYNRSWAYNQGKLNNLWNNAGKSYTNGIATYNGRYLVAVTSKFGEVGENIDIVLANGQVIHATIADSKSPNDGNYTEWGHSMTYDGRHIDIIEWAAYTPSAYDANGRPFRDANGNLIPASDGSNRTRTEEILANSIQIPPEWGNQYITQIINYGSILN